MDSDDPAKRDEEIGQTGLILEDETLEDGVQHHDTSDIIVVVVAEVVLVIVLIAEILAIYLLFMPDQPGSHGAMGKFIAFLICLGGLVPFVLSIIFTICAYKLKKTAAENGQLTPNLMIRLRVVFDLFWGVLIGFFVLLFGFLMLWK